MIIVQVGNFKVTNRWDLPEIPPEFLGGMGSIYHNLGDNFLGVDISWKYEGGDFLPPDPTVINYGTKITKLAFLNRLGDAALVAIETASRVNNALGIAASIIKIKHASSTYIDLSLDETKADMQKLVDYGFIDLTKKNEVLDNPVQEKEVPLFLTNQII